MKLQRQIDLLIAQRASEWRQILDNADHAQRAEFVAWLKQSPVHVKEYLEIVYADRELEDIDAAGIEDVDALLARLGSNIVSLADKEASPDVPVSRGVRRWPRRLAVGLVASLAIVVLAVPVLYERFHTRSFITRVGEQRTLQLADASVVTLNTDSDIEVRLNDRTRNVELLHGEALFKVAHDARRPFLVKTPSATIQAVGTQFNVYEQSNGTLISVLEGRVKVSSSHDIQTLGVGEEAQVQLNGTIDRSRKADVIRTVAWRDQRIIFSDTPLEDVVREFNRYNPSRRLTLIGVAPGSHHYNGIFDATDPDSLAALLSKEPDLKVEHRGSDIEIRQN